MEDYHDVVDVVVERSRGLTVTFADGHVAELDLMRLRLSCPCAACRSLRERGEPAWPGHGSPARLQIKDAALHGAWGLTLIWNDDHSTGIYTFELLREIRGWSND